MIQKLLYEVTSDKFIRFACIPGRERYGKRSRQLRAAVDDDAAADGDALIAHATTHRRCSADHTPLTAPLPSHGQYRRLYSVCPPPHSHWRLPSQQPAAWRSLLSFFPSLIYCSLLYCRHRLASTTDFARPCARLRTSSMNERICLRAACFCLASFDLCRGSNRDYHGNRRHSCKNSVKIWPSNRVRCANWVNIATTSRNWFTAYWSVITTLISRPNSVRIQLGNFHLACTKEKCGTWKYGCINRLCKSKKNNHTRMRCGEKWEHLNFANFACILRPMSAFGRPT